MNLNEMSKQSFSTKHIEYLEKDFLDELGGRIDPSSFKGKDLGIDSLLKVKGLSSFWELSDEKVASLRLFMEDIISGLHEAEIPLIFGIFGGAEKVELVIGTTTGDSPNEESHIRIVKTSLKASFQGIDLEDQPNGSLEDRLRDFKFTGLVTGTSTGKVGSEKVGVEQVDRLIRGLYGRDYGYLVTAVPANKGEIDELYNSVLNEMRIVQDSEKSIGMESPIGKRYSELLSFYLNKLQLAKNQGMWHTLIYIYSKDRETLDHAKAIVKSVFGGRESLPEPIRTIDIVGGVKKPQLIMNPTPISPGQFFYPYSYMTSLNSADLANFVNLPTQEMPGFQVKPYSRFHVSKAEASGDFLSVGEIQDQGIGTGNLYKIPIASLKKHGLVVGTTGSGKTNTIFYMLKEAWRNKVPFMVLEPAKTEYRGLLYSPEFGKDLSVFTLGDNNISPFRLNPFEIMPGIAVQTHIDLLKSVFNASFFMWGPLPQVLERCIHEIYIDKGWDLATNINHRGLHRNANPTLTDLYNKIDSVVDSLGYSAETTMEVKSALKTRINSMRIGGKGLMLDTRKSIPFSTLITKPTILELDTLGDDEEKSFMMGLILTVMYEHYVSKGLAEVKNLEHITVIEEAHRLLANYTQENPYTGNTRGKSVETFTNILSEIRAYGEGFLIAEQIPTKLAPDLVKNTNLKVMHRIVAEDDRKVMGATMNIQERETGKVTSFAVGEAAVYSEGDEGSYDIKVPYSKIEAKIGEKGREEADIRKAMEPIISDAANWAPYEGCLKHCKSICRFQSLGRDISSSYRFTSQVPRLALSLLDELSSTGSDMVNMFDAGEDEGRNAGDPKGVRICTIIHGAERYFEELGSSYNWLYDEVEKVKGEFLDIYIDALEKYTASKQDFSSDSLDDYKVSMYRETYLKMCKDKQPTRYCSEICEDKLCLYRFDLGEALADKYYHDRFIDIVEEGADDIWEKLYELCRQASEGAVLPGGSESATRKIALCFALQKSNHIRSFSGKHIDAVMLNLIQTSNRSREEGA